LARKAYGLHATQVNTSTYPDDGSSPVGSNEWNEALDTGGMLGFLPATANSSTIIVSSGVATITDSISVIAGEGAATDTLQKLALANTSQYDLVYLFAASSGYVVTLEHGDLNADGEISTVSGADEALSTTKPTILIRKGAYWYGYGGGTVSDLSITTAKLAADAVTGAKLADNAADSEHYTDGSIDLVHLAADSVDGTKIADDAIDSEHYTNASIDTAHIGNLQITTGLIAADAVTAAKIGDNIIDSEHYAAGSIDLEHMATQSVDEDNLYISNAGSNGEFLSKQSGNNGGLTWASAGGGATIVHEFTNTTTTGYLGTASSFGTVGAGDRDIYIKKIDSNNEGVFTKIWKNGSAVEVQLA